VGLPADKHGVLFTIPHSGTRSMVAMLTTVGVHLIQRHFMAHERDKYVMQVLNNLGGQVVPIVLVVRDPKAVWQSHWQRRTNPAPDPAPNPNDRLDERIHWWYSNQARWLRGHPDTIVFHIDRPNSLEVWKQLKDAFPKAAWNAPLFATHMDARPKVGKIEYRSPLEPVPEYMDEHCVTYGYDVPSRS